MTTATRTRATRITLALLLSAVAVNAKADAITDWNIKSGQILVESKLGTPPAIRVMAVAQTAAYDAVNAITQRYPTPRLQTIGDINNRGK